jgi:KDO2-lipid IV(A) lauroyltransferase
MSKVFAFVLYGIIGLLTLPPLGVLYLLEKPMTWLLKDILKYRRDIVESNFSKSFPEWSGEDLLLYTKRYYSWLSRVFLESFKAMHWSVNRLNKQFEVINPEILEEYAEEKQDVIVITGHTANWEWTPGAICPYGFDLIGVYKPQTSKTFDYLTYLIRKKKSVLPTPMRGTLRAIGQSAPVGQQPRALLLIADQIPAKGDIHYWSTFLNQETAWFKGAEKIALKKKLPVLYMKTSEVKKGKYSAEFLPLYDGSGPTADNEITDFYIHALEQTIRENPSHWLWSHRRWKHRREDVSL